MNRKNRRRNQGFTLLEIMMVVAIIALLLGAAIYNMGGNLGIAKEVRVQADIRNITTQLNMYQTLCGFYPSTEQGLQALVTQPESEPKPRNWHKLMDAVPRDAWDKEYVYVYPGKKNPQGFDIYSAGPDRLPDTADDIGNWQKQ